MEKSNFRVKEYSLVFLLSGKRKKVLKTIFEYFDLDGLKEHLEYWEYAGLVNEIDLFDSGRERRDLIEFCDDLEKVFEAFYIIGKYKERQLKNIPDEYKKVWEDFNICTVLSEEEKANLDGVLKSFSKKYDRLYALAEVVDMLEAVVTLKNEYNRHKHSAVPFFMCLNAIINSVYS